MAHAHLRYLNPFPKNLGEILERYQKILVPELNMGQLRMLIGSQFVRETMGYNKVQGKPFTVSELVEKIQATIT